MKKKYSDGTATVSITRKKIILIMRITTAFLLAALLQVSARGLAQKITVDFKNSPIEKVFREIQSQSGYLFIYNDNVIASASPVSFQIKNASIQEVLDLCLKNQPLTYELNDKTVVIKEKLVQVSLVTIMGIVTSEDDEPLEGVTVRVKNSGKITITNEKGEFILKDIPENTVLVVSSVGFNQQEINTNGNPRINIRLKVAVKGLDETVVMAYGVTSQRKNTGSISKVKSEIIQQQPVTNVLSSLEGRVPGLFITQQNGIPGSTFRVELRGINSIANGNQPLYIVDGVPIISSPLQTSQNLSFSLSPLNSLNPADIESVEVLKDADATAIYGSRGGNGVILITTRKAGKGKISVDVNIQSGFGKVGHYRKLLNNSQYVAMRKEAFANDNYTPDPVADPDILVWDTGKNVDWQKMLIGGTARYSNLQMNISQGNDIIRYFLSGNFNNETSVFPGKLADKRTGVYFSLDLNSANKAFKTTFSASYSNDINNLINQDPTSSLIYNPPVAPEIYDASGKLNWMNGNWFNPFSILTNRYNTKTENLIANINSSLRMARGLYLKLIAGVSDIKMNEQVSFPSVSFYSGWGVKPMAEFGQHWIKNWNTEPQLEYHLTIGKNKLSFLGGLTFQNSSSSGYSLNATGYSNDALLNDLSAAAQVNVVNTVNSLYRYSAGFGRITYENNDRYFVNLTARRDGSSRFGPGRRVSDFGAIAGGWIFSNEKFAPGWSGWLTYGKLRASYGISGNDQVGDYGYLSTYSSTTYSYNGISGLYPSRPFNADYGWERIRKLEFGLEAHFFKNRISVIADWYRNRSDNQLVGSPLPGLTGFNSILQNLPALVENKGVELEIQSTNIKSTNLSWTSSFSLTIPQNKLLKFPGIENTVYRNNYEVGKSLYVTRTYRLSGVDAGTGLYTFEDLNKDGQISSPGDYVFSNLYKKAYGGLSNSIRFKNLSVDIFIQFVKQPGRYDWPLIPPGMISNQPVEVIDHWSGGTPGKYQKYTATYRDAYSSYSNFTSSTANIVDASYIRLKNVSISYFMGRKILSKLNAQSVRIYVQGQNLLTSTKFKGYDPENIDNSSLPPLRMLTAGIQIKY